MVTPLLQSKQLNLSQVNPATTAESAGWQQEMKAAFRTAEELCQFLHIDPKSAGVSDLAASPFPVFVPHNFALRIHPGDPDDPLLRQVLRIDAEEVSPAEYTTDPIAESHSQIAPGILQKYQGRALMIATGACAVHCRYCFRRHFPYQSAPQGETLWSQSLETIRADSSIQEILLSGGDPLVLSDVLLSQLIGLIEDIPHVRRLRIHTRTPIMIPSRITDELLDRLQHSRLAVWFVVHINHAQELSQEVLDSLDKVIARGIPVLNQAVLLQGVNDSVDVLAELFERLVDAHITPYYLHQLDQVTGASHFEVPIERGKQIMAELRMRLPGYAIPRYVQELPGKLSKTVLA